LPAAFQVACNEGMAFRAFSKDGGRVSWEKSVEREGGEAITFDTRLGRLCPLEL
jgi:hypothetical protein